MKKKKSVTRELKKTFLKLTGWEYTGTWWTKPLFDDDGYSMRYEYLHDAYEIELAERIK